jgi:hypothetical protein
MAEFRPSNILLRLHGLDGLEEPQLLSLLVEPEMTDVHVRMDNHPTPEMPYAPKYLVYLLDFGSVDPPVIHLGLRLLTLASLLINLTGYRLPRLASRPTIPDPMHTPAISSHFGSRGGEPGGSVGAAVEVSAGGAG